MAKFEKASLGILKLVPAATAREKARFSGPDEVIDVQFNPTSLKLQYSNHADAGGVTASAQPRQNPAVQPSILSFDLEYDTAEDPGCRRPDPHRGRAPVRPAAQGQAEGPASARSGSTGAPSSSTAGSLRSPRTLTTSARTGAPCGPSSA